MTDDAELEADAEELLERLFHECKGDWNKVDRIMRYLVTHFHELQAIAERQRSGGTQ